MQVMRRERTGHLFSVIRHSVTSRGDQMTQGLVSLRSNIAFKR